MIQYVDYSIGKWIVRTNENGFAILVIKDIDAFCDAIHASFEQDSLSGLQDQVAEMLEHIEFAPIRISKNGKIKWKGGNFIQPGIGEQVKFPYVTSSEHKAS